jgi:hypothetical protein
MRGRSLLWLSLAFGCSLASTSFAKGPSSARYADDTTGLFWFMHISDLHVGSELPPTYPSNLAFAFNEARSVIQPAFVVATGDLVDASPPPAYLPTTGQDQKEWDAYKQAYTSAGFALGDYIDLPGNHDGYADIGFPHYLANSLLGTTEHALYTSWSVTTALGEYFFFGFDTAGDGSIPSIEDSEVLSDELADFSAGVASHPSAELVIALGHHSLGYPKNGAAFTSAIQQANAFYLHGHDHAYSEYLVNNSIVVNEVKSLGKNNDHNLAVVAIDHNALIYRATSTSKPWPLVMITAPVSSVLQNGTLNPYAYEVCKDRSDNPVRALVFSKVAPDNVMVQVGSAPLVAMTAASNSIWEAHVDTSSLAAGPQSVTVFVTVGSDTVVESILSNFVAGPCDEFPDGGLSDASIDVIVHPPQDSGIVDADAADARVDASPDSAVDGSLEAASDAVADVGSEPLDGARDSSAQEAAGGSGARDAATEARAGSGGHAGTGAGGSRADAHVPEDTSGPDLVDAPSESGGCGCTQVPSSAGLGSAAMVLAGLGAAIRRVRRRIRAER